MRMRTFTEAVLKYTGRAKFNAIGHSFGVTLARRILKGGVAHTMEGTSYNVGEPLAPKCNTFIAIAGANYGLENCMMTSMLPTCNEVTGFYPGDGPGPTNLSRFM